MNNQIYQQLPSGRATPEPKRGRPIWTYVLTVLITASITFMLTAGGAILIGVGLVKAGLFGGQSSPNVLSFADDAETREAVAKLKDTIKILGDNYYEELSDVKILEALVSGVADRIGSRYTMYLTAEQYNMLEESMQGEYVGIGALVMMNRNGLVEITEVLQGSPAEAAGVRTGDVFLDVDGVDVSEMSTVEEVAAMVKGEEGTIVELLMFRPTEGRNLTFRIERRRIVNAALNSRMLTDEIGYIQIREFTGGVAELFAAAIDDLQGQGAQRLVIDLRNNSGGRADEVIRMLDYILPKMVIATIQGRADGRPFEETWHSDEEMAVPDTMRYAILINGMSASASELFSGCLRDHNKAYLIGEQSFGKGSGTQTFLLPDKSAVNVTTFLYYLPNGESIEEVGLTPDLPVVLPEEAAGLSIHQLTPELDTQLAAALDYLENPE
ncbi:MAG: S41 family peptidase [Clostridiaceae bacterium]|nr:S41 family peptidase [Clostridiaceae bacterium]